MTESVLEGTVGIHHDEGDFFGLFFSEKKAKRMGTGFIYLETVLEAWEGKRVRVTVKVEELDDE